ncbi:DnaK suppressor protein [Metapseudomonas resinovorans]
MKIATMPDTPLSREELLAQPAEAYMNESQRAYFRDLLERQREELRRHIDAEFGALREVEPASDEIDLASREEQRLWQLRLLEREKRLLDKIDEALSRIARGEYGWCEESGDPIGLRRLLLRPTATLCLEAKQRQELQERHQRPA